ncbi:T9SS type B sorting domain-containing protein [Algibacter lectus]|uniref:Gliding motility-associated-like protein n=1 Tax=Algibacter lectus TaxID=221126 RepID=A0A4R8M6T0_9FLAO|nr:T9SS type B sorting domain-containing protein [Algibacter lectus]MWW25808.1 T9SS type B sorting domain-containing protein [Algibacter lectus]TDY61090.1 gliding motility-associated-like protein [Algibacter lectus]
MKNKYLLLLFLVFLTIFNDDISNVFALNTDNIHSLNNSEISGYTMNLTAKGEECAGDGNIQIEINASEIGATFEFLVYDTSDLTTPINSETVFEGPISSADFTTNITTINSGTYIIRATETIGATDTIIEQVITVANNIVPITFDAIQESACLGTINVLLNSGNVLEYRVKQAGVLIETITQAQIDAGTESTFTNLAFGDYTIEVEDVCGNIVVQGINLIDLAPVYTLPRTFNNNIDSSDCSQTELLIYIIQELSTGSTTGLLDENFFPFDVTITYDDDADGNDSVMTDIWTSNSQNGSYYNLPTQDTSYPVTTQVTDICGNVVYLNTVDFSGPPTLDIATGTTQECGGQRLRFSNFKNFAFPMTLEVLAAPTAFDINNDPNLYNPIFPVGSNISDPIPNSNTLYFGYYNLSLPDGNYTFVFKDNCGREVNKNINIITDNSPRELSIKTREGCDTTGNLEINIKKQGTFDPTSAAGFKNVTITSAPANYTGPSIIDIAASTVNNFYGDFIYLYDLPAGDYTFDVETTCGYSLTGSKTINGVLFKDVDATITSFCGSFNLNLTATYNITAPIFVLQKFNTTDGVWANINNATAELTNYVDNTHFYRDGSTSIIFTNYQNNYGQFITESGFVNNVTGSGLFRIYYSFSRTSEQERCYNTLQEFTIGDNNITLVDFSVIDCGNGTNDLLIDALGVNLNYELISRDGVALSPTINNGKDPVFTGLTPGLYEVQISDDCGAISNFVINANKSQLSVIQPYNLCVGENGFITTNALSIIDVTWTKDGDPSFSATGNTLNFTPYSATDTGTYNAVLSYSANPNSCANQTLSYTVTSAPPIAGNGQTVDIAFIDTTLENLFDYINGPYDNFGIWTETTATPSGTLNDNLWDATGLEAGTYVFDYVVDTGCNGIDSTTVTINILESDLTAIDNSVLDICPSTIHDNLLNVLDNDTYGQQPLVQTDFLVTTETADPENVITIDAMGNINVNNTSLPGQTYTLEYKITETTNTDNFDTAFLTVTIKSISESVAPTFSTAPTQVQCYDDIPSSTILSQTEFETLGNADGLINNNNCGLIEITAANSLDTGNCNQTVTRTYTVIEYLDINNDNIYNTGDTLFYETISTEDYLVNDTVAPSLTGTIAETTIAKCSVSDADIAVTTVPELELMGLTITDSCSNDNDLIVTSDDTVTGTNPIVITRTYTIKDRCDNATSTIQIINIEDNESPTINCAIDITIDTDTGLCTASNVNLGNITALDNCTVASLTNNAPTVFPTGDTTIIWTATDGVGNTSTCEQIVTVEDNESPTFTAPDDIEIFSDINSNYDISINITGDVLDEIDNCSTGIQATFIDTIVDGECPGSKIITRTWSLEDTNGNSAVDQIQTITVLNDTILANQNLETYNVCDDTPETDNNTTNNTTVFDLSIQDNNVLNGLDNTIYSVSYYPTFEDAEQKSNTLPNLYENTINPQTIYARVDNNSPGSTCHAITELGLMVESLPYIQLEESYLICVDTNGIAIDDSTVINIPLNKPEYSFSWYYNGIIIPNETEPSLTPNQSGEYNLIVTDMVSPFMCSNNYTIIVEASAPPQLSYELTPAFANMHDVTVTATASEISTITTNHTFSLNDGSPQLGTINSDGTSSYTFTNIKPGYNVVTANNIDGCGENSIEILVIDYPLYFTPNSDGYNDTWNIYSIDTQPDAIIYIFDRYGRLLKQLNPKGKGWDGTYNGNLMPTNDYWFTVEYREPKTNERKIMKAHFTLKR